MTNWYDAKTECTTVVYQHLATIQNDDERLYLKSKLQSLQANYWIGAFTENREWKWIDGGSTSFDGMWADKDAANLLQSENCVQISTSGYLSDRNCQSSFGYICMSSAINQWYECREYLDNSTTVESAEYFVPQFADIPVTVHFTINNNSTIELLKGEKVKFFCEVSAIPEAVAVITGSNLSRILDQRSNSSRLELVLDDVQCTDSGRYFCWGSNGLETNLHEIWKYVDILMECAPAVVDSSLTIQISKSGNTTITLEILGYPEPTAYGLQIQLGQSMSNTDDYNVVYTKLTPPFGLVTLTIYDENKQISLTYIFTILNVAGNSTITFDVVKKEYNGIPVTISFTVNDMVSIELTKGEKIKFFCEVEAIPEAVAVITGSNLSRIQDQRSNSSRLELVLDEVQCTDSGRYFCWGSNGFETNSHEIWKFVDILMECAPAVVNRSLTIQIPESGNTTITLEILGYPEPTAYGLQIQLGQSMSNTDDYNVFYTKLTPPFGLVTLTIYDENTQISLTYIFTIMNSAGNITFTFDVVKQDMSEKVNEDVTQLHVMVYVGVTCGLLILLVTSVIVGRVVVNRWSSRRAKHHDYGISGSNLHRASLKNNLSGPDKANTATTTEPPLHTVETDDSYHQKVQMEDSSGALVFYFEPPPDYPLD
ncbi:uncharacterized protein LOC131942580 [Physella acuta]|uniref:uncharacterized protein LOC131942580 n=1 Tax=Physella acuta TaxID=109671 RepID=UPI0027DBDCB7|nr:uncharacterized protein LOC131942580 [Physella acuta]